VAFPQTPLTVYTELKIGGAWTDISSAPYHRDQINIAGGRQDEGSRVDPAACTLTVNNRSNAYSPRNPVSPLYGLIGRNTPLRVSVAAGSAFLRATDETEADARVSTPSAAAVQVTGDLDVRWDVEPDDWDSGNVVELGGKWGAAGQRSWHAYLFAGSLRFGWTTNGTTEVLAAAPVQSVVHPRRMCLRVTVDVDNGASGRSVAFYSGPSMAGPWTPIGGTQTYPGTSATFSSTASLDLADVTGDTFLNSGCRIYAFELRSGIGGTVVANPTFTAVTPGATSFTDTAGLTWTASSPSAITNRRPRHFGEVSAWPQRWDVDGKDVYVPMQSAGIMRRLGQGAAVLDSPMRRSLAAAGPIAYWPLEDGSTPTQAASGLVGGAPMLVTAGAPSFAAIEGPPGSLALPDFSNGGTLTGTPPVGSATSWAIEAVMLFPDTFTSGSTLPLEWTTAGTTTTWQIIITPGPTGGVTYQWQNDNAASVHDGSFAGNVTDGRWHQIRIVATQSGTSINSQLWLDGVMLFSDDDTSQTLGVIRSVRINPGKGKDARLPALGHLAIWSPKSSVATFPAVSGYTGESPDTRLFRLTSEEGVPLLAPYGLAGDTPLGPQSADTLLNVLQAAMDADSGILYEARHTIALAARGRVSLYNQPVTLALNYAAHGEVPPPLEPTEDDTATRNDVTRSRPNGSSARATLDTGTLSTQAPPLGVGRYQDQQTVNVQSDDQLADIAAWWLHMGTWDEARYPSVTVDLAAAPWLVDAVTAVDVGDRIQIANPPPWLAPGTIDLIVQGYTETIGMFDWTITFNCSPAGPWSVAVADDSVLGRADTDGSRLAGTLTSADTHLLVEVTAGPPWVTDLAELPFDLRIGGEVVTVTDSLSGPIGDRFDRTVASGWGTATSGQAWTTTGGSSSDYSISGG
jgi:hypothetical protein